MLLGRNSLHPGPLTSTPPLKHPPPLRPVSPQLPPHPRPPSLFPQHPPPPSCLSLSKLFSPTTVRRDHHHTLLILHYSPDSTFSPVTPPPHPRAQKPYTPAATTAPRAGDLIPPPPPETTPTHPCQSTHHNGYHRLDEQPDGTTLLTFHETYHAYNPVARALFEKHVHAKISTDNLSTYEHALGFAGTTRRLSWSTS